MLEVYDLRLCSSLLLLKVLLQLIKLLPLCVHGKLVDLVAAHKVDLVAHLVDVLQEGLQGILDISVGVRVLGWRRLLGWERGRYVR